MITLLHRPWARNAASSVLVIAVTGAGMAATAGVQDLLGRLHSTQQALAVANARAAARPGGSQTSQRPGASSASSGSASAEPLPYEVVSTTTSVPMPVPVAATGPASSAPTTPAPGASPTPSLAPTPRPTPAPGPTVAPTPSPTQPAVTCTVRVGLLTVAACIDIPLGDSR